MQGEMFDVFNKQMYDSLFTGKEIAYENLNRILLMFVKSFNTIFVWLCMVYCMCNLYAWTAIWFILAFLRQGLPFLVNLVACRGLVMAAESCYF